MNKIIEKRKGKISIYNDFGEQFENTFNKIHATEEFLNLHNLETSVDYPKNSEEYEFLNNHLKMVNLFSERVEVPNKKVQTDLGGSSMLLRKNQDIEIARRRRNSKGEIDSFTDTPNKCFITNDTREKFFKTVKNFGHIIKGLKADRYILSSYDNATVYNAWSLAMDKEYHRLSGINPRQKRKMPVEELSEDEICQKDKLLSDILDMRDTKMDKIKPLMKLNQDGTYYYDKYGNYIQTSQEEFTVTSMYYVLRYLTFEELKKVYEDFEK